MLTEAILKLLISEGSKYGIKELTKNIQYKERLEQKIILIIEEYRKAYSYPDGKGVAFFEIEVTTTALAKFVYYQETTDELLTIDYSSFQNIKIPSEEELIQFRDFFRKKVNEDSELKEIFVSENWKEEIFKTNSQLSSIASEVKRIADAVSINQTKKISHEIKKKFYELTATVIERTYFNIEENSKRRFFESTPSYTIVELSRNENKRIKLVSDGGSGKTFQLDLLASYLSNDTSFFPIKIALKDFRNSIESLLDVEFPEWNEVPSEQCFFIFDAFDEIPSECLGNAISNINLFRTTHNESRILVSSRNYATTVSNEFRQGDLNDFKVFTLNPISKKQRTNYLITTLEAKILKFEKQVEHRGLEELVSNAFFLVNLVNIFKGSSDGTLPMNRNEVFTKIIENSLKSDSEKYNQTGDDWSSKTGEVLKSLKLLAVSMVMLDRNQLPYDDAITILKNKDLVELILKSSLINQSGGKGNDIQFVHNNIKEYLAAKTLSGYSFSRVKEYLFHSPDNTYFKVKWTNTCVFLFEILDKESVLLRELSPHFIQHSPSALVRFEKDKIEPGKRQAIFYEITRNYWERGISFAGNVNEKELIEFSDKTDSIIQYLIDSLKKYHTHDVYRDILSLLGESEYYGDLSNEIRNSAIAIIGNADFNFRTQLEALNVLAKLKLGNEDVTKELLNKVNLQDDGQIREGICNYFSLNGMADDYIETAIAAFNLTIEERQKSSHTVYGETYYIKSLIKTLRKNQSIKKLLDSVTESKKSYSIEDNPETFELIIDKSIEFYYEDESIYNNVIHYVSIVGNRYSWDRNLEKTIEFFSKTDNLQNAFKYFLDNKNKENGFDWIYPHFADESTAELFISKLKKEEIELNEGWRFLHGAIGQNRKIHDYLYKRLNQEFENKFTYANSSNYDAIKKNRIKRDFELLKNIDEFIKYIREIFESKEKDELTKDELWELKKEEYFENNADNNIVLDALRHYLGWAKISKEKAIDYFNSKKNWEEFRIYHYNQIHNETYLENYDFEVMQFIQKWCLTEITDFDFKNIFSLNSEGRVYHYPNKIFFSNCFINFYKALNIDLPEEKVLDMLIIAERNHEKDKKGLYEIIIERLGPEKVKKTVLNNLINKFIVLEESLSLHIELCGELIIEEAVAPLYEILFSKTQKNYIRNLAFESIKIIRGQVNNLENLIPEITLEYEHDYFEKNCTEALIEKQSDKLLKHLKSLLSTGEKANIRVKAALYLINCGDISGLIYLTETYKNSQLEFDNSSQINVDFTKLNLQEALPLYEDIFLAYYSVKPNEDGFYSLRQIVINTLYALVNNNEQNYIAIRQTLQKLIDDNISTITDIKHLNYVIEDLTRRYYDSLNDLMTLEVVCQFNENSLTVTTDMRAVPATSAKQLPSVVILTAIKEEYLAVRNHLKEVVDDDKNSTAYEKGIFVYNDKIIAKVYIRECGTKNTTASQETERAIQHFAPDAMLFVGIAGSRKPTDFKIGDVIFPEKIYYYEGGKAKMGSFQARPEAVSPTFEILEKAKKERNKKDWQSLIKGTYPNAVNADIGIIASGEQLIDHHDSEIGRILTEHYNDSSAVEMEGFGFAKAVMRQGMGTKNIIFGVVRGISDIIEESQKTETNSDRRPDNAKQFASDTAAAFAFWLILKMYDSN